MRTIEHYRLKLMTICFAALLNCVYAEGHQGKWDYEKAPVKVKCHNQITAGDIINNILPQAAFDGYGSQGSRPAAIGCWYDSKKPSRNEPFFCEIDYGRKTGVSAFVNYCYVPDSRDLRYLSPAPSSFKDVIVLVSDDGAEWKKVAELSNLKAECPQVLKLDTKEAARYWRLEIPELVEGAEMLLSYEIETWTDGIPEIESVETFYRDFKSVFTERILTNRPNTGEVRCEIKSSDTGNFDFTLKHNDYGIDGRIILFDGDKELKLNRIDSELWQGRSAQGSISMKTSSVVSGQLLELSYQADQEEKVKYCKIQVRLNTRDVNLYYMPAYAWNRKPVDVSENSCLIQTRMAVLGNDDMMLCLLPGTDRGRLGFQGGQIVNELLLGPENTPVLLTAIKGDWWDAYQFAVKESYDFKEQPQTVPVSEIVQGVSRFMMTDKVWQKELGTVRSYPEGDFVDTCFFHCYDNFSMYGAPYSIPVYLARYVAYDDKHALERARSIALWLCRSKIRVHEGPAKGGFFSTQRIIEGTKASPDVTGCNVSGPGHEKQILTSQSTGASLWALLYYRKVTGEQNTEINHTIEQAAQWLQRFQQNDGGWAYAYDLDGKTVEGAPSAGAIWNIWALWRLGQETGNSRYLHAAEKGKYWFDREFVRTHHYHGYWEDVGAGSREGYEAALAAVAFAEMGEEKLCVLTAQDAVQWVFTRQIEPRDVTNSAGLVSEQTGWPPAAYATPMMGLAAWNAWQITKDDFWKPFAMIPKAVGWWYNRDEGSIAWIVETLQMAPIVNPGTLSQWCDWVSGQVGSLSLRWLLCEFNRRLPADYGIDEESFKGRLFGESCCLWFTQDGLYPSVPAHGQVNWLGFRSSSSIFVAFLNFGSCGDVMLNLDSRDVNGAVCQPKGFYRIKDKKIEENPWDGKSSVQLGNKEMAILQWDLKK